MPLPSGTRLGPYEIISPLGAGGMGEVYRALDPRLGREVAIKVLPQHLAATAEIRARFDREARTISQLNFPHICTLYDVGHESGIDYLVMELLEGETLHQRLTRGPLPMPDVLLYGRQVAEALDRAHRAGVVHRDLKPGNIMLTKSGAKLMDFGLARGSVAGRTTSGLTQSPTQAAPLTAEGTIVGTFQYMAPEQLEGKEADARSDLWALGCVLYEMATGTRAFAGDSQASLIGAIMRDQPVPVTERVPAAPPPLGRLVAALLAKDPDERIQTAHDAKLQLLWAAEPASGGGATMDVAPPARRAASASLAWGVAIVAAIAALTVAMLGPARHRDDIGPVAAALQPPPGGEFSNFAGLPIAIAPDGKHVAYVAHIGNGPDRLWVRTLASSEARELPGTDGASMPFFSPDGGTIAFFSATEMRRVDVNGGPVTRIVECSDPRGGTWGGNNTIVYAPSGQGELRAVDATGGIPRVITQLDTTLQEATHRYPCFLPDGVHFLYLARRGGAGRGEKPGIYLASTAKPGRSKVLEVASNIAYASGRLLYVEQGNLVAQPFDLASGKVRGPSRPISNQVSMDERFSRAPFAVSQNGVLVFMTGDTKLMAQLEWKDRHGTTLKTVGEPGLFTFGGLPVLDATGRRALIAMFSPERGTSDVWIVDTETGNRQRLSVDNEDHYSYCWGPTDNSVVINTLLERGSSVLVERSLNASAASRTLAGSPNYLYVGGISRDGKWLLYDAVDSVSKSDVCAVPMQGGGPLVAIAGGKANQSNGSFSPDSRFVAYDSNESGRGEVFVVPFPATGAKWQVSAKGGTQPAWSPDGGELFFLDSENYLNAVAVKSTAGQLEFGPPQPLFQVYGSAGQVQRFDVAAGGQRFLVASDAADQQGSPVMLVTEWVKTLGR